MLLGLISLSLVSMSACYYHPTRWDKYQIQLSGNLDDSLSTWADLYDADLWGTTPHQISEIHAKGARVICYFSAGSMDIQRDDAHLFHHSDLAAPYAPPYTDETWLDIRSSNVRYIMGKRMDLAKSKHCDGIRPDNLNGYAPGHAEAGFTFQNQLEYNRWLAHEAHNRDMSIGLINDIDQLPFLHSSFDWALNEECHDFSECGGYSVFINEGKPVYNIEFVDNHHVSSSDRHKCDSPHGMSTQFKDKSLSAWVVRC